MLHLRTLVQPFLPAWRVCKEKCPCDRTSADVEILDYPEVPIRPPIHPGESLAEELTTLGITPTELAHQIAVPPNRISQIINGRRAITGNTALPRPLVRHHPQPWLNLQFASHRRTITKRTPASPTNC